MLVRDYHTDIVINAPIQEVWAHLTDFSTYPEWN
ncbi:MAG: SRPBCC domain-containing protein, partial [Merismopedia sp. SIO2A8]|nr:SRPBCC domain-containing protein [Merismopedia sp. SIO2A8]